MEKKILSGHVCCVKSRELLNCLSQVEHRKKLLGGGVWGKISASNFKLKNHFVLGFVPFGGCFEEFIAPFVTEMKTLENGITIDVQGTKSIVIAKISAVPMMTRCKEIAAEYRLCTQPPILDNLKRERHLQSPHDVYHAIAGKVLKFLRITIDALSSEGKLAFILS
ncbi:hypothetical protein GLOIN_2v1790327 [Rhizophagus irregularis DAOM 181602=DAOM 197198]|uniref:Uncharacterized protein n=2 Tax=Rhizophagus irregularis TaxID=588596 RepID=A0A2P4NZB4_RHIID|nr:hypothetical protein GLOIN_2v1790327 [Rhizophagus irregularis DAOM 181602=DAOM 197198]POG58485.1 hypothetical protein GLOIN_2v1790327 [Rhizophagus irregularis DAOM 181602=DAOM 197198]|eukprot:XP_025165351.1 hypothetical protein GLOIN_2v1790327 [Rhizophagus irregularis DAOM 181602=DAOM 197198]